MSLDLAMSLRMGTKHGKHGGGPPPSYTGPLDLTATPAVVAYGQRAMKAAQIGSAIYTLRRDSDDATMAFPSIASGGVDPAAVLAWAAGANVFVAAWNDGSGNDSDVVQATAANQPGWLSNSALDKPALVFARENSQFLTTTGNVTLPDSTYSIFVVCRFTAVLPNSAGSYPILGENFADAAGPNGPDFVVSMTLTGTFPPLVVNSSTLFSQAEDLNFNNGSGIGATDSYPTLFDKDLLLIFSWNSIDGSIFANGSSISSQSENFGSGVSGPISWPLAIGADDAVSQASTYNGQIDEILIFPQLPSPEQTAISQNIASYYGITLS